MLSTRPALKSKGYGTVYLFIHSTNIYGRLLSVSFSSRCSDKQGAKQTNYLLSIFLTFKLREDRQTKQIVESYSIVEEDKCYVKSKAGRKGRGLQFVKTGLETPC